MASTGFVAAHRAGEAPSLRLLVVGDQVLDGFEHGVDDTPTLCGMAQVDVFVMRHLCRPDGRFACPTCATAVR